WHRSRRVTLLATAADEEQRSVRRQKPREIPHRLCPELYRQDLQGVGLEHEVEPPSPVRRRREQVGRHVLDARRGKALTAPGDGGLRDVEGDDAPALLRQVLRIVAEPAANRQASFVAEVDMALCVPLEEVVVR